LYKADIYSHPKNGKNSVPKSSASQLISFGTRLNINTEGSEKYVTFLLANLKEMLEEPITQSGSRKVVLQTENKKFTAFEIKEKLKNFVEA
jgi:translation initiation factor 2 beta subunit (eIF-2beta)/eIF-5